MSRHRSPRPRYGIEVQSQIVRLGSHDFFLGDGNQEFAAYHELRHDSRNAENVRIAPVSAKNESEMRDPAFNAREFADKVVRKGIATNRFSRG